MNTFTLILARPDDTLFRSLAFHALNYGKASDILVGPFNSSALVVTEFIVKNRKQSNLEVYHFSISQYFLDEKP